VRTLALWHITKIYITGKVIQNEQTEMTGSNDERPPRPTRAQREFKRDYSGDGELPEGRLDMGRFFGILGTATAVSVFSFITIMSVGTVIGATLGAGFGGFVANFENVTYNGGDAKIYPIVDSHAACDNAPQLEASLEGSSTLTGDVEFFKDLPLPSGYGLGGDSIARISIIAQSPTGGVDVNNLGLRLTALNAENAAFGNTVLREFGPNQRGGSPSDSFSTTGQGSLDPTAPDNEVPEYGINSTLFDLTNGTAAAHYVTFDSVTLAELDLAVIIDDKSKFSNPVERVVNPTDRDCQSLADAT